MLARVFAKFRRDEDSVTSHTAEPVSIAATPPASAQADNGPPSTVPAALAPLAKPNSVPVHLSFSSEVAEYGQVEALLKRASETVRAPPQRSQPSTADGAGPLAALANPLRSETLRTSRIVQIHRDSQDTAYLARDCKSGLVGTKIAIADGNCVTGLHGR
jgi:hypothetical protein